MSELRRNSLSALYQRPALLSLETRAATDFNNGGRRAAAIEHATSSQQDQRAIPNFGSHRESSEWQQSNLTSNSKWEQKNLLTFDGGGIRGYATVLMLEALMRCIGEIERTHSEPHQSSFHPHPKPKVTDDDDDGSYFSDYLPCHYFDYMVGTSTGGLIAVMLSRWRMTIKECRSQYEVFGREVFRHRRKVSFLGLPHDKHHKAPLVDAIKNLERHKTPIDIRGSDDRFETFRAPNDLCRTAVIANEEAGDRSNRGPYIFRSYDVGSLENVPEYAHPRNHAASIDHPIWQVCRATTAAPTFFRPQIIDGKKYSDGAIGTNNPTEEAIDEMRNVDRQCPRIVVSFGTGKPAEHSRGYENAKRNLRLVTAFNLANELLRTAKATLTDCEKAHKRVEKNAHHYKAYNYFRFNIEEGLGKMKIDECKPTTQETLKECTRNELAKDEVRNKLRKLAGELVNQRRERIRKYPGQWERFACCTSYECESEGCINERQERISLATRNEMMAHLLAEHSAEVENSVALKARLDRCRRLPVFPAGPW